MVEYDLAKVVVAGSSPVSRFLFLYNINMNNSLLKYKRVFYFFNEICNIPHSSGNTKLLTKYIINFSKKNKLDYYSDLVGNIIIFKNKNNHRDSIILQSHIDMVYQSNNDIKQKNINLIIDNNYIRAKDTTLGADNGIGVAMMLAILENKNIKNSIEAIFTVDEEIGFIGAKHLDINKLSSKYMINLDSFGDSTFIVGSAGGNRLECNILLNRKVFKGNSYLLKIGGLISGHSGDDINKGRANANIIVGYILKYLLNDFDFRIYSIKGGSLDNVITKEAEIILVFNKKHKYDNILKKIKQIEKILKDKYLNIEKNLFINIISYKLKDYSCFNNKSIRQIVKFLINSHTNGVQKTEGVLIRSSLNLGIIRTFENLIKFSFCLRSMFEYEKKDLINNLKKLTKNLNCTFKVKDNYKSWKFKKKSKLRDLMVKVYKNFYKKHPKIEVVHAGLECSLFLNKIKNLDCISIGPNIFNAHTCEEKVEIKSIENTYNFLIRVLKYIDDFGI